MVYFGLGEKDLSEIIHSQAGASFLLTIGEKQLIKRKAFERYLDETYSTGACGDTTVVVQSAPQLLDNCMTTPDDMPFPKGVQEMATKINRTIIINGEKKWIHANTEQEYADKLAVLFGGYEQPTGKHNFSQYAQTWFDVYSKPNIATATATTYQRQLRLHIFPVLGDMAIEDITTDDVQRLFNGMTGTAATKQKAKQVLNMVLETALDDGLIQRNPLQSKRVRITGDPSKSTEVYTLEQMRYLIQNIDRIRNPSDKIYLVLQALHPLRLEEVLGLQWDDIDMETRTIHIQRAVTHPDRNRPEIKPPKTEASNRSIGLSQIAASYLSDRGNGKAFVLGGKTPYSYQQIKRMCQRIQQDTGFKERITPIRFRTTVLTDIYEATKDVKAAQAAAGHTTSAMTLKHYVKGRGNVSQTAEAIDRVYGS